LRFLVDNYHRSTHKEAATTETATSATTGESTSPAVAETAPAAAAPAATESSVAVADGSAVDSDVTAGVKAAKWSKNVTITYADTTFTFASDGLPSHELPDQFLIPDGQPTDPNVKWVAKDTKTLVKGSALSVQIPLKPVFSSTVTKTTLGQIGVMISGAQLFNDYEDPQLSVVAVDDNKRVTPVGGRTSWTPVTDIRCRVARITTITVCRIALPTRSMWPVSIREFLGLCVTGSRFTVPKTPTARNSPTAILMSAAVMLDQHQNSPVASTTTTSPTMLPRIR
jgi:hypothetical protein